MITVEVIRDAKGINCINTKGHSGYEDIGKDIVCSSVSTSIILTYNLLNKLNIKFDYVEDEKIPMISLKFDHNYEQEELVQCILENLVKTLEDVEKQFKKYLQIKKIKN